MDLVIQGKNTEDFVCNVLEPEITKEFTRSKDLTQEQIAAYARYAKTLKGE